MTVPPDDLTEEDLEQDEDEFNVPDEDTTLATEGDPDLPSPHARPGVS